MDRTTALRAPPPALNTDANTDNAGAAPTIERVDSATIFNPQAHASTSSHSSFAPPSHNHPGGYGNGTGTGTGTDTGFGDGTAANPRDSQYTQNSEHSLRSEGRL
ncbi:hypothetical protein K491DRAFT_711275 [Lophiostoma macrostomum CBS 122681]|uniref:Uncharacterized protein n=1 Tax=Lophiostoma macrostomum CBS 122681 TaxID=1314788 RepID=A0A6A6TMQ1_9PLEO|nr:hypothetical protein K491DRAFT_711275 [Lophiostoma macrostomum CBS 122681]